MSTIIQAVRAPNHDLLVRLSRIEGQVRGIARMVEQDRSCIDTLTQITAVHGALQQVVLALLSNHLKECLIDAARAGGVEQDAKLNEAADAIARLIRS